MRKFASGATRDTDEGKLDYEAFLSPLVLERYAEYMDKNAVQADGTRRSGDNWQKGMGLQVYMKSLWRHFFATWKLHRVWIRRFLGSDDNPIDDTILFELTGAELDELEDDLCAVMFNAMGYLHDLRRLRGAGD